MEVGLLYWSNSYSSISAWSNFIFFYPFLWMVLTFFIIFLIYNIIPFFWSKFIASKHSYILHQKNFWVICLTLIRLVFLRVVFFLGGGGGWRHRHISRRTDLLSVYLIYFNTLNNLFRVGWKLKKCWYHLLYADVTSFFGSRKSQKIQKLDENS